MNKLVEQIYTIIRYIRALGTKHGIVALIKIKRLKRTDNIRLRGIKHPIRLRINGTSDKTTFYQIFLDKEYEISLLEEPKFIIDAGANIGLTSVYLSNRYPNAKIIAIEPDKNNFEILSANTKPYANVIALNTALWSNSCHIKVMDNGLGTTGFTVEPCAPELPKALKAMSLEEIMKQYDFPRIDLLKMDIEGSEKYVLSENSDYWISRTNVLIIELHDRFQKGCSSAFFKTFAEYDFAISPKGENFILTRQNYIK